MSRKSGRFRSIWPWRCCSTNHSQPSIQNHPATGKTITAHSCPRETANTTPRTSKRTAKVALRPTNCSAVRPPGRPAAPSRRRIEWIRRLPRTARALGPSRCPIASKNAATSDRRRLATMDIDGSSRRGITSPVRTRTQPFRATKTVPAATRPSTSAMAPLDLYLGDPADEREPDDVEPGRDSQRDQPRRCRKHLVEGVGVDQIEQKQGSDPHDGDQVTRIDSPRHGGADLAADVLARVEGLRDVLERADQSTTGPVLDDEGGYQHPEFSGRQAFLQLVERLVDRMPNGQSISGKPQLGLRRVIEFVG